MKTAKLPPARIDLASYEALKELRRELSAAHNQYLSESEIIRLAVEHYKTWRADNPGKRPARTTEPLSVTLTLAWLEPEYMEFLNAVSIEDMVNRSQVVRDAIAAYLCPEDIHEEVKTITAENN
jgi:metal-responsive CopG/Arc/MetJ family transcriptional regulator